MAALSAPAPIDGTGAIEIPRFATRVNNPGSVSFSGLPVCDAAALVLGDELGMPYTCEGSGALVSLYYRAGDPDGLYRTFSEVVRRTGGTVARNAQSVHVSGGQNNAGGMSGTPPAGNSGFSQVSGVHSFTFENELPGNSDMGPQQFMSTNLLLLPLQPGVSPQDVQQVNAEFALDVRPFVIGGRSYAVVEGQQAPIIEALLSSASTATVPLDLPSATPAQIEAYQQAYPALTLRHDPQNGVVWVTGSPGVLSDFAQGVSQLRPARDYRVEATFLSLRETDVTRFEALAGLNLSARGVSIVTRGASPDYLRLSLDAVESTGVARVLSRPSLSVRTGSTGRFVSGQSVPVAISETRDSGEVTTQTVYREAGVVLRVTPTPTVRGTVRLVIHLEISTVGDAQGVGGNPIFDTQEITSEIEVSPGDVVSLSGLQTHSASASRGRNLLLPSRSQSDRQEQLAVFISLQVEQ